MQDVEQQLALEFNDEGSVLASGGEVDKHPQIVVFLLCIEGEKKKAPRKGKVNLLRIFVS